MVWADLKSRDLPSPNVIIPYGHRDYQLIDLWLPADKGPHPVVIMVHGGCWQKSIADRTLMNYAASSLREAGLAVWNIEYPGVDEDGGGYPGTFNNVAKAANFMHSFCHVYHLDMGRVAGFGHSAGGHLMTWYAASPNLSVQSQISCRREICMRGVINSGGLADLKASESVTLSSCLADIKPLLTGPPTRDRPDPLSDTSSDRLLPTDVKIVSINGDKDEIAPPHLGESFTANAKAKGNDAEFHNIPHEGHVELISPGTKSFTKQLEILIGMLAVNCSS